jgi:hypothetical protein
MPSSHRIALAYLARHAEGEAPLLRFRDSYARYAAGIEHQLVVIYKGFRQAGPLDSARSIFASLPHVGIEVADTGFDIGAYLAAAARLDHEYLCFANTFTEVNADGWLGHLYRNAALPGVGIAGATGSYESLRNSLKLTHKLRWLCNEVGVDYDERLLHYYDFVIGLACPRWKARGTGRPVTPWQELVFRLKASAWRGLGSASLADFLRPVSRDAPLDEQFERHWSQLLRPGRIMADYAQFPAFPNPHIRSNGFLIHRERFLELGFTAPRSKIGACVFESGSGSLTARLRRKGLRALVIDKDGRGYDVQDWTRSRTFRLSEQEDLLLHDKQTRGFDQMPPGERLTHRRLTWGDYLGAPPDDYPDVGLRLAVDEAATGNAAPSPAARR